MKDKRKVAGYYEDKKKVKDGFLLIDRWKNRKWMEKERMNEIEKIDYIRNAIKSNLREYATTQMLRQEGKEDLENSLALLEDLREPRPSKIKRRRRKMPNDRFVHFCRNLFDANCKERREYGQELYTFQSYYTTHHAWLLNKYNKEKTNVH